MSDLKDDLLELPRRAWLRPDEVGRFLGFSTRHIRRLAEEGAFLAFRAGTDEGRYTSLRIARGSVLEYVKKAVSKYQFETGAFDGQDGPTRAIEDQE